MTQEQPVIYTVEPEDRVTTQLFAAITGYSVKAIENKRARGEWVEGREWFRAPDGRVLMSRKGYREWAQRSR